jgi:hypothetical protein
VVEARVQQEPAVQVRLARALDEAVVPVAQPLEAARRPER